MAESNTDFTRPAHVVGSYALYGKLAAGGMATVHLGRQLDSETPGRMVAVKRLHPQFCKDPEFVAMFIDEARLAARIKHRNVVETLDIVPMGQELLLVMEYIRGECFSKLLRAARRQQLEPSFPVIAAIACDMLHGLHAAHEVRDDEGRLLNVVHRDISPQNVMIGVDGVAKVLDFGVAKASARIQITRDGQMKGKLSYMSPEQLQGLPVDRRADVFACGVVLWEALTRRRLFVGEDATDVLKKILKDEVTPPSELVEGLSPELDAIVLRALNKDPEQRYQTAEQVALDIERTVERASPEEVGAWINSVAGEVLQKRERLMAELQAISTDGLSSSGIASESDPAMFEQLQLWAEREAARAAREGSEPAAGGVSDESPQTIADAPVSPRGTLPPPLPTLGDDDVLSAVTEMAEPNFDPDETIPTDVPARTEPVAPTRGGRLVMLLAAAATVIGISAFGVFRMNEEPIATTESQSRRSLSLQPEARKEKVERAPSPPPSHQPAGDTQPALQVIDPSSLAEVEVAEEPKPVKPEPELAAKPEPEVAEAPAPTRPSLKRASVRSKPPRSARRVRPRKRRAVRPPPQRVAEKPTVQQEPEPPKEDCRHPYYVDENGIRRLKMACL